MISSIYFYDKLLFNTDKIYNIIINDVLSIEFNCFDGNDCVSQSLSIANTGVNTSKLYRMEQFVDNFPNEEAHLTGEMIHKRLDEIEQIHTLYSPVKLGLAAALA